jgi:AcrR family transcriptional regulator
VAKQKTELTTEEKIKEAARTVFLKKGYAATRTRDIAEKAGINLALLNYYFRSKEKLFEIIMYEKMQNFFGVLFPIINDEDSTLEEKVEAVTAKYTELLLSNKDLPIFVLSELRSRPEQFQKLIQKTNFLKDSVLVKQLQEKRGDVHPIQFMVSIIAMVIFPYVMRPVLQAVSSTPDKQFEMMMRQRNVLIPTWTKAMLKAK